MADGRHLDESQARAIEEELFATRRQQSSRHMPVALPRQNFWESVGQLLADIDADIQHMLMNGMTGLRLQNAQKRQANIRRIASELARKRMVTMMQHIASQSLRIESQPGLSQELPPIDWLRNDPAEKAFYHSVLINMDRFKKEVDWASMQKGVLGEAFGSVKPHSKGTMQLDSFVEAPEGLTGSMPPDLVFDDDEKQIPVEDSQYDEEDRIYDSEWPDFDEFGHDDLDKKPEQTSEQPVKKDTDDERHSAALELAPSKKSGAQQISLDDLELHEEVQKESTEPSEITNEPSGDMIRIRVLQSLPEPIMVSNGVELTLEEDDVHFIDKDTADWLVESGVAEVENL